MKRFSGDEPPPLLILLVSPGSSVPVVNVSPILNGLIDELLAAYWNCLQCSTELLVPLAAESFRLWAVWGTNIDVFDSEFVAFLLLDPLFYFFEDEEPTTVISLLFI